MSSAAADAYRAELVSMLADLELPLEGFRDYDRLNVSAETQQANQQSLADYARRQALISAALVAMDALDADGYPDLPVLAVPASVLAELQENSKTIQAALARYQALVEAESVETVGELIPKERRDASD